MQMKILVEGSPNRGVVDSYIWMPIYQLAAVYGCEIVYDGNMTSINNTSSLDLIANSMVSIRLSKKINQG